MAYLSKVEFLQMNMPIQKKINLLQKIFFTKLWVIILPLFFSSLVRAVPEKDLENTYKNTILPFYLKEAFKGTFLGQKNKKVAFYRFSKVMGTDESKGCWFSSGEYRSRYEIY